MEKNPKPFLRWAGGKKWLLKDIDNLLPENGFNNYHEPFLGGGAIFFYLDPENSAFLSDLNPELIEMYTQVKENVELVIRYLRKYRNTKDFYYEVRDIKRFNSPASRAARFIYLNQTSFNGIYRVNLNGKYNVPYGFRDRNYFYKPEKLRNASHAFKKTNFSCQDFSSSLENINKGDLVFLDPPYTITHNHNGFFKYNKNLFTKEDQFRLAKFIVAIKEKGAYYMMTNAAHNEVKKIFKNDDMLLELSRASTVGGKKAKRGRYREILLTNTRVAT